MKKNELEDPAEFNPWKRYFLRSFITNIFIYLTIIIPGFVFYFVSIFLGFSITIGIFFAFISFLIYVYFLLKYELWNKIDR